MEKLSLCIVTPNLNPATGYGNYAASLINALRKKYQLEIKVLTEKFPKHRLLGFLINPLMIAWQARNCDVIHALDGYPYGIYAQLANLLIHKMVIITLVGTYAVEPLYQKIKKDLLSWAYKKADVLTAISRFTAEEVKKVVSPLNIKVINPGINLEKYLDLESMRALFSGNYILSVGSLTERKGYHIAIPSFALAKKVFPDLKYVIVGQTASHNYRDSLQKLITKYGLEKDITFMPMVSEEQLSNLYRHAKVFLLPSINIGHHFEGFGLVFLEAGAHRLPVVGASGSGAEDAIQNYQTGILIPQKDIQATAAALIKILSSEDLRKKLGQSNWEWAKKHDWLNVAAEYYDVYNRL